MILAIIVSIYGLIMLIRGKGIGADAPAHPHYRLLGGFLLTYFPAQVIAQIALGIVYAIANPDTKIETLDDNLKVPSLLLSLALLVFYLTISHFWEKSIKRRAAAASARRV